MSKRNANFDSNVLICANISQPKSDLVGVVHICKVKYQMFWVIASFKKMFSQMGEGMLLEKITGYQGVEAF